MKKLTAAVLMLLLILQFPPALAADLNFTVAVGEFAVYFGNARPYETDGTVMLAVEPVAKAMGLGYSWYPTSGKAVLSDRGYSVELIPGQLTVKLSGSTFIADEVIALDGRDRLYVSASTMARLAESYGFGAKLSSGLLELTPSESFFVIANDSRVKFTDFGPVVREGRQYVPLEATAQALGLSFSWYNERRSVELVNEATGRRDIIDVSGADMTSIGFLEEDPASDTGNDAIYEDNRLFISADRLISTVEGMGGSGSYNYYGNGLILSLDRLLGVKANGNVVVFPDIKVRDIDGPLIPLRPVTEALNLDMVWDSAAGTAEISDGQMTAVLRPGSAVMEIRSGNSAVLDREPVMISDRLAVGPGTLTELAVLFGMNVLEEDGEITITAPDAQPYAPVEIHRPADVAQPADTGIKVELDGKRISFSDVEPFSMNGRTLIPVRAVAEEMGLDVEWDGGDGVVIHSGNDHLRLTIGSDRLTGVRGGVTAESELDVAAMAVDGRTCVPIRAVMEFFGAVVEWEGETSLVKITTSRESRVKSVRSVPAASSFGTELGFTINAPLTGTDMTYSVINGNTARVRYANGSSFYLYDASRDGDGAVLRESDFSGPLMSRTVSVNGISTHIYYGTTAFSTQAAIWTVGAYSFSLEAEALTSDSVLNAAEAASKNFVIVKEIEPEDVGVNYSPDMTAVTVDGSSFFRDMGIIMTVPEGSGKLGFKIYDGSIAEISFNYDGYAYILRAAKNAGDLTGAGIDPGLPGEVFALQGTTITGSTQGILRYMNGGGMACSWIWGDVTFSLSCGDPALNVTDFRNVCTSCAELSSRTSVPDAVD